MITVGQYDLIYNAFSFGFATLAAATLFFWLSRSQVAPQYKTAITITGLVTFIAAYHYFRIFMSWEAAYVVLNGTIMPTGKSFNEAYRYVDWLLTVPLLLVELILVMGLSKAETISRAVRLGSLAALMIVLGYPGETAPNNDIRLFWGAASMIPFLWIVYELFVGLSKSIKNQPENVRELISLARYLVIGSWAFYPVVYFAGALGIDGGSSRVIIEVGYTIADITAKAVFGVLIFMIAVRKSEAYFSGKKASA